MRRRFGHRCMVTLYLIGSVALGVFAYHLQRPVYHPSPPPGEMYAVVFAHDPAAHLRLSADIYPNKPWYDSLNVVVGHVPRSQAGWLLVVECPGREPQSHAAKLYSAVTLQTRPARSLVTVKLGTGNKSNILFGCVQGAQERSRRAWVLDEPGERFGGRAPTRRWNGGCRRPSRARCMAK